MNFAAAADELRHEQFTRIIAAVPPTLNSLRALTPAPFRVQIAMMMERLGHSIVTDPGAPDLVTVKEGRKFITACAKPTDPTPTGARDLKRLHHAVMAANAEGGGIYVTPHGFTADAEDFARSLPIIRLVDGAKLMQSMARSFKDIVVPETYKAMCCQCGAIVRHRLDKGEAVPCGNGHIVLPTIALGSVMPPKPANVSQAEPKAPAMRPLTRREIRAYNYKLRARMTKTPRAR
jgi:Restriction endonuclease